MADWSLTEPAAALHRTSLVWDAHSCLPLTPGASMADLERHRVAGVDYVSINVGMDMNPVSQVMRVIAGFRAWLARHDEHYLLAGSVADVERAKRERKLAVTFDLEGSVMLEDDLAMVQLYRDLGVRQIHLAYNRDNSVAGGCHGKDIGLSKLGREVVAEVNRVGLIMDCSHSGYRTSMDVMAISTKPVVFSHANPWALKAHARNIRDDQIDACAKTGGVVCLNGIGIFLGANDISVATMVRHIDYVAERVGPQHVGLGLDYMFGTMAEDVPPTERSEDWWPPGNEYDIGNMKTVPPEAFPEITEALLERGYREDDIRAILGGNMKRVAEQSWG